MKTKPICKIDADGTKFWCLNGELHREDGPAVEYASGTKFWYINGKLHREDGPACEYTNGNKHWYLNGKELTEDEFNKATKTPLEENKMTPQTNDGGPAFPCPVEYDPNGQRASYGSEGMTLRDYFAGQALAGLMVYYHEHSSNLKECAAHASAAADAMLAAREETK